MASRTLPILLATLVLVSLVLGVMAMPAALGQNLADRRQYTDERPASGGVSLDRAVQMAESHYRAKAVKATTVSHGDRRIHQIRLIREGKVWTVNVDADSGAMY